LNFAYPLNVFERDSSQVCCWRSRGRRMEMSEQGPAIADHAPIFEKHTITYSSAMAMRAV
jgi:hypothetical protein